MDQQSKNSLPSNTTFIKPEDFEAICFNLARDWMDYDQPIPNYSTRDSALLESALGLPSQTFDGKLLYPTLTEQAAVLFYSMIKNHPFQNGNKRIATVTLWVFLAINYKWLAISAQKMYELAMGVSESEPKNRDAIIQNIINILNSGLTDF